MWTAYKIGFIYIYSDPFYKSDKLQGSFTQISSNIVNVNTCKMKFYLLIINDIL